EDGGARRSARPSRVAALGARGPPPRRLRGARGAELQFPTARSKRRYAIMFIAYEVSLELIRNLREVVPAVKAFDRDPADQIRRAASSVSLNLAEGQRLTAGNQRRHYEIAHGSANEVRATLDVAAAWGWIDGAEPQRKILDRLLALLWRLTN